MAMTPQRVLHKVYGQFAARTEKGVRALSLVSGVLVAMALAIPGKSLGAEWSVQPSLGIKGLYNSNLVLRSAQNEGTAGYGVTPGVEFAGRTERLEASGRVAADFIGYYGGVQDGSGGGDGNRLITNVFVPLTVKYKTEKDLLSFTGGFTRDNTLLSELQTTGVALLFAQRNQWTANPTWTRSLTEKLSFLANAQLSYTMYGADSPGGFSNTTLGRLVDNRVVGGSGGFLYQLTERDQLQLTGSYAEFHTINALSPVRASFPGVSMSVAHAFDESLTATVYGGPKFLSSTTEVQGFGELTTSETVWVAGAKASKRFERAEIEASIARDLMPSGFGLLIATNRAEFIGSYYVSETITCSVNVVGALTSGKTESANRVPFQDQRYVSFKPAISWKFYEWWEAELSYMYRWRDIDRSPSADSHATTLMFTYYPPKLSFSR